MAAVHDRLKKELASLIAGAAETQPDEHNQGPKYSSWFTRIAQLIDQLGPEGGVFAAELARIRDEKTHATAMKEGIARRMYRPDAVFGLMVGGALGVLRSLEHAIDAGLLGRVEDWVASEVYGDVLDEAEQLLKAHHVACAAILGRIGLDNGLKRKATREGMPDVETSMAGAVNLWLWKERKLYPQSTFNLVQSCLDPGNAFAHKPEEAKRYTEATVAKVLQDTRTLLATHLA